MKSFSAASLGTVVVVGMMMLGPRETCMAQFFMAAECGPVGGSIAIAGSTTVAPVARAWAEAYGAVCADIAIAVEEGGSSEGADRVCAVEGFTPVDIGDLSRPFEADEAVADESGFVYQCTEGERSAINIEIAIDGLAVVMATGSAGSECVAGMGGLTPDQLRWIYSSYTIAELRATDWNASSVPNSDGDDDTHLWSELNATCPAAEIKLAGPDSSSTSYEYFLGTVLSDSTNGEAFGEREDGYFNSTDVSEIVEYLQSDETVIAFISLASFVEDNTALYGAPILNEDGFFVGPSEESIETGGYTPLSRRIFMNLLNSEASLANTAPFITFAMSTEGTAALTGTGFAPMPESVRAAMVDRLLGSNATLPGDFDVPPANVTTIPPTEGNATTPPTGNTTETEPPLVNTTETVPPEANATEPPTESLASDVPSDTPSQTPSVTPSVGTATMTSDPPSSAPTEADDGTATPEGTDAPTQEPAAPVAAPVRPPVPVPAPPTAAGGSASSSTFTVLALAMPFLSLIVASVV